MADEHGTVHPMRSVMDPNVILNIVTLMLLLYGVPRYLRAKTAEGRLAEKDSAIATHEQTINALQGRVDTLEHDVRECRQAAQQATSEAKAWQARYDEQSKYTAEPALLEVRDSIKKLEATTSTALGALGELVMKSNELLARQNHSRSTD